MKSSSSSQKSRGTSKRGAFPISSSGYSSIIADAIAEKLTREKRIPKLEDEKKTKKSKKRKKQTFAMKYGRLVNDWQNPLDIEVKF